MKIPARDRFSKRNTLGGKLFFEVIFVFKVVFIFEVFFIFEVIFIFEGVSTLVRIYKKSN